MSVNPIPGNADNSIKVKVKNELIKRHKTKRVQRYCFRAQAFSS